jgi:pyruvate kinase
MQGINYPDGTLKLDAVTDRDFEHLAFGLDQDVDWVAVSFVRSAADILRVRAFMEERGKYVPIMAKIEKHEALEDIAAIVLAADGIMVARGDLGVEMPPEKVPAIQKHVIRRAAEYRKPVITATQMLESMIDNPRPTRAEASDVANAIYDGTDAVMLSGETAAGKYPVEAVKMMAKIVSETESNLRETDHWDIPHNRVRLSIAETICESAAHAAEDLDVSAIAVFTESGTTARQLSKYRPKPPIYALSSVDAVIHRMSMLWGVHPIKCPKLHTAEQMVDQAESLLEQGGFVKPKEILGIVAGTQTRSGSTNFLRLHVLGDRITETVIPHRERTAKPTRRNNRKPTKRATAKVGS